jgi:hypothetical protein
MNPLVQPILILYIVGGIILHLSNKNRKAVDTMTKERAEDQRVVGIILLTLAVIGTIWLVYKHKDNIVQIFH